MARRLRSSCHVTIFLPLLLSLSLLFAVLATLSKAWAGADQYTSALQLDGNTNSTGTVNTTVPSNSTTSNSTSSSSSPNNNNSSAIYKGRLTRSPLAVCTLAAESSNLTAPLWTSTCLRSLHPGTLCDPTDTPSFCQQLRLSGVLLLLGAALALLASLHAWTLYALRLFRTFTAYQQVFGVLLQALCVAAAASLLGAEVVGGNVLVNLQVPGDVGSAARTAGGVGGVNAGGTSVWIAEDGLVWASIAWVLAAAAAVCAPAVWGAAAAGAGRSVPWVAPSPEPAVPGQGPREKAREGKAVSGDAVGAGESRETLEG